MGTKTISLDDEAYERLKNKKTGNESFSDVVKRIISPVQKKSLLQFAGVWKLTDEEFLTLKSKIKKLEGEFDDMFGQ